jgi:hypothetical protein
MLVRKKRENLLKKKAIHEDLSSGENLQSLGSWIRKIEQSTTSVSSRLSAVEKRLSIGMIESGSVSLVTMEGPVEKLVLNVKKKNASELARALDGELSLLHNGLVKQEQELGLLKEQLVVVEKMNTAITAELQTVHTAMSQMNTTMELRLERTERREPFVMRLGAMEIPIEFTGIIGGLLAFTIAILVAINQKAVLLSPVFLFLVGVLLIGSAMLKMVRTRSRSSMRPYFTMPLTTPSVQINSVPYEQKEV